MESLCFVLMFLSALDTVLCQDFKLFVASNQGKIYTLNETGKIIDTIITNEPVVSITTDPFLSSPDGISILFSTNEDGNGWIFRHNLTDGTSESLVAVEIQGFEAYATSLQVDQASGNIFFTRILAGIQGYNLISAQTPYADQTTILPDLNLPSAIAVHAGRGLLFWSDRSNSPFIGSATMAGTESGQMIKTDIEEPTGLAIDFIADRLYWADASLHKIESCDFDGEDRNVVLSDPNTDITDIVLDGDYLYYNSRTNNEIMRVHVSDSGDLTTFATISGAATLNGMAIYSPNLLLQTTSKVCSPRFGLGDCSTICLPTPSGHRCGCGFEIEMLENGKTCENATVCSDSLPNGDLDISCTRHRFETCNFTCIEGFQQDIVEISCNGVEWNDTNPCSSAGLGGICSESGTSCYDVNTMCDPDKGKCICKDGFFDNDGDSSNLDGTCVQKALVGSTCVTDAPDSCMDENAFCDTATKQCICGWDFYDDDGDNTNVGGVCISKKAVGEFCSVVVADSCSDANAVCNSTTTQCTCLPEYYDIDGDSSNIGGNCIKKAGLQENCSIQAADSCYDMNAICDTVTVKCSCSDGYSAVGGMCTVDCPQLEEPANGYLEYHGDLSVGSLVNIKCDDLYTLNGHSELRCLAGGIWDIGKIPECKKDCDLPDRPNNGWVRHTGLSHGSAAAYVCYSGYLMTGKAVQTCLDGSWSDAIPTCSPVDCGEVNITNGNIRGSTLYGGWTRVRCDPGYYDNGRIWCGEDGLWVYRYYYYHSYVYRRTNRLCHPIDCHDPPNLSNTFMQYQGTLVGSIATYYFQFSTEHVSTLQLTCKEDGLWSGENIECSLNEACERLNNLLDGYVEITGYYCGAVAVYRCHEGYKIEGTPIRHCINGIWNGSEPVCSRVDCGYIYVDNGVLEGSTYYGDSLNLVCDNGYDGDTDAVFGCRSDGFWESIRWLRSDRCYRQWCGTPVAPNNGLAVYHGTRYGDVAEFVCAFGYKLTGSQQQVCQENGTWSDESIACELIECPTLEAPENGLLSSLSHNVGAYVTVSCNETYMYFGDAILVCLFGGTWTGSVGHCAESCKAGTYITEINNVPTCVKCPKGEYQPQKNQDTCLKCDDNSTTVKTGTTKKNLCFPECGVGHGLVYGATKTCQPCSVGQYNQKTGDNSNICKDCPNGLTTDSEGQTICTVPIPVFEPYDIHVNISLIYEAETDCSDASLGEIRETLEVTITGVLELHAKQYIGLCGFKETTCNNVKVSLGNCTNVRKRETTSPLQVDVSIPGISNTVEDTNDLSNKLSTGNVIAEIFETGLEGVQSQLGESNTLQLASAPSVVPSCNPGFVVQGSICEPCVPGTFWVNNSGSCSDCPTDTYQENFAQTQCMDCPELKYTDTGRSDNATACMSFCEVNPAYCNYHGKCIATGKRLAECVCYIGYNGKWCEQDIDECLIDNGGCQNECTNFDGGYACSCLKGYYQDSRDPTKCRVNLFQYGDEAGDQKLQDANHGCSEPITPSDKILIYGTKHDTFYVCSNGLVSFDEEYWYSWPPRKIEDLSDRTILAPFFTYMDFSGTSGAIYYHEYDLDNTVSFESNHNVLQAKLYISDMFGKNIKIKYLFVSTWFQARRGHWLSSYYTWFNEDDGRWEYEYIPENAEKNVTVQLVIATDRMATFAMYLYGDQQMNWVKTSALKKPNVFIGYSIKGGLYSRASSYSYTNLALEMDQYAETADIKGILVYDLKKRGFSPPPDSEAKCLDWYDELRFQDDHPEIALSCPCNVDLIIWDPWFMIFDNYYDLPDSGYDDVECYDSWESWRRSPNAMRCCYDKVSGGWISDEQKAGGLIFYHPRSHPTLHQLYDVQMKDHCCNSSTDNCDKFRQLRPVGTCYDEFPWQLASMFGDPHISTLDGKSYTFNGWGEYVLLKIKTNDTDFSLQCRTERALTEDGKLTDATVFTAFASLDSSNASLLVELAANKAGMIIFGNGVDLTLQFRNKTKPFAFQQSNLILTRQNESLNAFFVATGLKIKISLGTEMLTQEVTVPKQFQGLTEGLLGNFDGNASNDFTFKDGHNIDANSSEREVFPFGQSWMTSAVESIFKYGKGLNHANFSHPEYTPKFLDEADPKLVENATITCGETNLECIFDLVFTRNDKLARETQYTSVQHAETLVITHNKIPSVNGTRRIEIVSGETIYIPIYAFDEEDVTFTLSEGFDASLMNITGNSAYIYFRASELLGKQLSVMATDVLGKTSAPFVIEVVLCSGCSGHGLCNFKEYKNDTKHTNPVKYAKCICDGGSLPYWAGENCEHDFDGCSYQPCSVGQDCIDYNATYHQLQAKAYECSACPDGYDTNNDRCQDRNECLDNNGGCQQVCLNTEGSFQCLCNSGYRLSTQDPNLCEDIHECDEALHSCQHTCVDTVGAYNCSCYQGFRLATDGFACIREEDVCADSNIDCSATDGCKKDTGVAQCFCNTGFELSDSGLECVNVDECLENVCSQTCTDTEGSFKCGCQPGFTLENDGTTCVECDESHWGLNCANICKCGQGALRCDRSKGCVCENGWTEPSCNADVDECAQTPNMCNDVNKECTNTIGSYECSCREGFQLDQNEMCEDINECNSLALNECQQTCSNVLGSFTCSCNSGYLSDPSDALKCIDLDECETGNADCEQLCVNVAGSFNCDCYFGYLLNDDRKTCRKVEDVCAVYGNLNCSHFCVVDATEALCKCPSGYEIGSDNQTCIDIKECDDPILNVCSQPETCQDFEGGFQCSCQIGFKLENDGLTCRPCDDFHYGMKCENKCDCEVGADYCDPVSGCICLPGWNGKHCEQDNDECNREYSPCTGLDTECINTPGSYNCVCQSGFKFASNGSCSDINECENPGLNICDQNCTNTVGSFICTCADGFMFINGSCQDIDECLGLNDCQHECINTVGGYRCRCKPGYILDLKNRKSCIPENECSGSDANDCLSKNAECVMVNGQPTCECQKGYEKDSGDICADIKECELTPCSQICYEEDGGYACQCESGFKLGPDSKTCLACEDGTYGIECSLSCTCNVQNTLECERTTGGCTCRSGWTGNNCSDDIDECLTSEDINCTANSECLNTNGSYICQCTAGFINGSHGDCIDIDECVEQTDLCSQDCINTVGGYDCQCLPGYKSSGYNCTDCAAGRWGVECREQCLCVPENTENCSSDTGHCFCKTGWTGSRCESDINECHLINTCDLTTETCENTNGSFICKCNEGLGREETKGCIDIDECLAGIADCFHECVNTPGSYECHCNQGFKNEGNYCSDIDECAEGTDLCSQDCINTIGSYECQCSTGYKSAGYSCTECKSGKWGDECQNDCLCELDNTDFCDTDTGHCECQNGWTGPSCETDINECLQEDICDSETVCENRNGTYYCKCKDGLGRHDVFGCIDIDECIEGLVSCEHFCVNTYGSYNCQCNKGYRSYGNNCTDVDECSESIARCPQECINTEGSYTCNCSTGYQTSNYSCAECEADKWGDKCQNDCLCIPENTKSCNSVDGHCDCQIGWTGDSCEKDINECLKYGTDTICDAETEECKNTNGSYKCNCKAGFGRSEDLCRDIDECVEELDDCSQDCINTYGSYQCKCRPGFSSSENICTECEPGKWGYECNETCACVQENMRSCSPVHGYCHCNTGWYGQACENDTDECREGHSCNVANEVCQNTAGSYECNCKEGFKRVGDACAVNCLQGTYKSFVSDVAVCMPCPRGEYQDEVDQDFCKQCDSGYTTMKVGSLTSKQCFPECVVGQGLIYDTVKICQPCAKGQYNDKTGENPNLCKECPSGLTTDRAGQSVCTVSAPVVAPYQTVIALPLLFEVNADCAVASMQAIRESIKTTIRTKLMEYEKRYKGLCGVHKNSCNDMSVILGSCTSLKKREATHLLEVNVSISDISSTLRDTEDQNTSLSTVNLIAELFESDPNAFTPQGGQGIIQYIGLAAAPTATVMCDTGKLFADGRCQCPNNHYGDDCSAQCECETENTVTPTQSCDSVSGKCLCLPTWGGERCSMDIDECLSGTHDCDAVENRICQNRFNGFNCICKTGYAEGPNHDCIKEKDDNYGLVVGLSIGIPLGVLALVAINLFFCLYLRRSNKKRVPEMNVREEFVSSVYRNMPTSVPEGTAAFRSIGSWYSAPVTPTPSSSRRSNSRSWLGMPIEENRNLHIDRPKVSRRPSDLFQE